MCRRRRPFLSDRFFFLTVKLLSRRPDLAEADCLRLAQSIRPGCSKPGLLVTAWVFLPDHWHTIIDPPYPLTISRVMKPIKVSSTISINRRRRGPSELWPGRFFDHALRTVQSYVDTVEYIHLNQARCGLVRKAQDWKWSSVNEYSGMDAQEQERRCGLTIDRLRLPGRPESADLFGTGSVHERVGRKPQTLER